MSIRITNDRLKKKFKERFPMRIEKNILKE